MKKETLAKRAAKKYWHYANWLFDIYYNGKKEEEKLIPQLKKLTDFYESQIYKNGGKLFG